MMTTAQTDDLRRDVYGVMGIPIDVIDMAVGVRRIEDAAVNAQAVFHFDRQSQFSGDQPVRSRISRVAVCSAICARPTGCRWSGSRGCWGVPIRERVAGSDIFDGLRARKAKARPLKVFLFGGAAGAANAACKKINSESDGMTCVGFYEPGFGSVDEMSTDAIIGAINASNADFLVVALGAKKGQLWLLRNRYRLRIPVRAHLGAVINFQAGTVRRAPLPPAQAGTGMAVADQGGTTALAALLG